MILQPVNMYIGAEDMDSNSPWCRKLDTEQILKEIIEYATEEDLMVEQAVDLYSDEIEDIVGRIVYIWGSDSSASVSIEYNELDEEYYSIPLDNIPFQVINSNNLHDFNEIVAKGIEIFKEKVDSKKFEY